MRPDSPTSSEMQDQMPYAVFAPEVSTDGRFVRRFAWGEADLMDPDHSDFSLLRDAVLGHQARVSDPEA